MGLNLPGRLVVVLMLIGVVGTAVLAWLNHRHVAPARIVAVDTGPVAGHLPATRIATLASCRTEPVYGIDGARVIDVPAAGSRVDAGQTIVRLRDTKRESELKRAAVALAGARHAVNDACRQRATPRHAPRRLDPLLRDRVAEAAVAEKRKPAPVADHSADCADARAELLRASRDAEVAGRAVQSLAIVAPFSGIVDDVHPAPGGLVADVPLLRITDDRCLRARAAFPHGLATWIALGATACLQTEPPMEAPQCVGRVAGIDADGADMMVEVVVRASASPGSLRIGDPVTVMVPAASDAATRVSRNAIDLTAATPYGWKVDPDSGRVHRQVVEVGIVSRTHLHLLSGARPGEQFAVALGYELTEGSEVVRSVDSGD